MAASILVTNTTPQETPLSLVKLGLFTNYGSNDDKQKKDAAKNDVTVFNTTDGAKHEVLNWRGNAINEVYYDSALNVSYPSPVKKGSMYTVEIQDVVRETDELGVKVDHPVVMYLTVRHEDSESITPAILDTILARLISMTRHDDGTSRWNDLRGMSFRPKAD